MESEETSERLLVRTRPSSAPAPGLQLHLSPAVKMGAPSSASFTKLGLTAAPWFANSVSASASGSGGSLLSAREGEDRFASRQVRRTEDRDDDGILSAASELQLVGMHARLIKASDEVFNAKDPAIKQDIIRMIAQYLGDEGFNAAKMTLLDESNVKSTEREEHGMDVKRIKKCILEGDWPEIDRICSKPIVKNQKAFLYAMYKQQFLEYIEHHEIQKAFTHLNKRLKPLEHYQTTPQEFKDICYLLTSKSVQDVPSFKNWEGIVPSREKLVELFQTMVDSDSTSRQNASTYIPPNRLLTLLRQAVAYQVEFSRYYPRVAPKISTLLQNFEPIVIPNAVHKTFVGHKGAIKCVDFVGELGRQIISGSTDNVVRVWDTESAECIAVLDDHTSCVWDVASNASGSFAASASGDGTVKIWDLSKMQCTSTLKSSTSDVYSVEWHPGSNHIVTGGYDSVVRLFDVERGVVVKTFSGHGLPVSKAIFSPLGNLIVSASKDSTIKFWDIVSGLCIKTITSHLSEVTSVEMSGNGTLLLSSSKDNSNRLWDTRTAQSIRKFKGHQNTSKNFVRAGFAGDSLVVGGSEDSLVHVWDLNKGTLLSRLPSHGGIAYSAIWNSSQSLLCSCSDDRAIKTWWFDPTKPVVTQY
ncbi:WD40-repeat-containing domain protein [Chytriomyces sp. MP71]|nr:WD40-repeat-containing domain protein [Chytriomyces sp. MP71]